MRKLIALIMTVIAINSLIGQKLETYFSVGNYHIPGGDPYIETYLFIAGRSIEWKQQSDVNQANIEITIAVWQDTSIIGFSKEVLNQTLSQDEKPNESNLTYIQRISAKSGQVRIQIKIDDLNDTLKPIETGTITELIFPEDSVSISSIMPVQSYTKTTEINKTSKSGYDLVPAIFNYYPNGTNNFTFYSEIYCGKKLTEGDPFLLVYYIKNHESNQIIPAYKNFKRMTAKPVNILLNNFDITKLNTGKFEFVVEVRDISNQILSSKSYYFQRENTSVKMQVEDIAAVNIGNSFVSKITNKDTLQFIIRALAPISAGMEKEFANSLVASGSIYTMQQYLLNFWEQRSPMNPEAGFTKYMKDVSLVETMYKTRINHGFETDRGRVYLQYGPPNTVAAHYNEPSAYPYEIWHYYQLQNQRNRKFVFYNSDLASNEFRLLHSDAIGEPNNYQWRIHLRARDAGYQSIDQTGEGENNWGSRYNEWFEEPR